MAEFWASTKTISWDMLLAEALVTIYVQLTVAILQYFDLNKTQPF